MIDMIIQQPLLAAFTALVGLSVMFGAILGFAAVKFKVEGDPIVERIDALLPQTQCGQCGYPGCRPYAQAIADGDVINKCPPGGQNTVNALATLLDVPAPELDVEEGPDVNIKKVAYIREAECIGCTKCIQACPVDAILGAAKLMHTVITSECTGCDLCVEPCPVDCIEMRPIPQTIRDWHWAMPTTPGEQIKGLKSTDIIASDRSSTDDSKRNRAA